MSSNGAAKKILIIKPSSLGDVVHSLPFLNALTARFPRAEIHWIIAKGLEGILEGHPMIDKLLVINKDAWKKISQIGRTSKELIQLIRQLRNERYDITVDLQGLFRSGAIAIASGAPLRIGFSEAREGSRFCYNKLVTGGKDIHAVERYMKIAGALGCDIKKIVFSFPDIKNGLERVADFKHDLKDYAVIVPGARWQTKIWPAVNFGKIASMLPMKSVVIGSRADIRIADEVVAHSKGMAISLAGKTDLKELTALMRDARLVVSNDSGPMHIAAAFSVAVVAIFGPTSPKRTGPYGSGNIVITSSEKCSPCFKKKCSHIKCMELITVADVYAKIGDMLHRSV